jgi:hypothetical protein
MIKKNLPSPAEIVSAVQDGIDLTDLSDLIHKNAKALAGGQDVTFTANNLADAYAMARALAEHNYDRIEVYYKPGDYKDRSVIQVSFGISLADITQGLTVHKDS